MVTTIENEKKKTIDYQHHTNKATAKSTEGKQQKTRREGEKERLIDKNIVHVKEEEEEAEIKEEGGDPSTMVQHIGPASNVQKQQDGEKIRSHDKLPTLSSSCAK